MAERENVERWVRNEQVVTHEAGSTHLRIITTRTIETISWTTHNGRFKYTEETVYERTERRTDFDEAPGVDSTHKRKIDSLVAQGQPETSTALTPASSISLPLSSTTSTQDGVSDSESDDEDEDEDEELAYSEAYPRFLVSTRNTGIVYKWTNLVNGKGYVGKALNEKQRYFQHLSGKVKSGRHGMRKLQLIDFKIQQYGASNFKYEVLKRDVPRDELIVEEGKSMVEENTMVPHGYNILPPGVESISGDIPHIRDMIVATKRAQREEKLARMPNQAQADELRIQLDKMSEREMKKRKGEDPGPDGRFGRNDKRRAIFAAKREARMALMTPQERAKYERISATKRKSDEKRMAKRILANQSAEHVAWMKQYRKTHKGVHLPA